MAGQGIESRFGWFNEHIGKRGKCEKARVKWQIIVRPEFRDVAVGMENGDCSKVF